MIHEDGNYVILRVNWGVIHEVRAQNFPKELLFLTPCAYQGVRNVTFSENFVYVLNGWFLNKKNMNVFN